MFTEILITRQMHSQREKKTDILKYFTDLLEKTWFDISCKLSP